jgi:hypothetical protein
VDSRPASSAPPLENLSAAAGGENEEWSALYPSFAAKAREEGFKTIGVIFDMVSVAEKQHERRFRGLLGSLQNGRVFKRDQPVKVAMPELRIRSRRPSRSSRLSSVCPSTGIFRGACGELVSFSVLTACLDGLKPGKKVELHAYMGWFMVRIVYITKVTPPKNADGKCDAWFRLGVKIKQRLQQQRLP